MEYRAILAAKRPLLEHIAPNWLDANANVLFSRDDLGVATLDLTLRYSRPTTWFFTHFRNDLILAARRSADHAVAWMLIGALHHEPGYAFDGILGDFHGDVAPLRTVATELAVVVQDLGSDSPELDLAVTFWRAMVDADRQVVPVEVLDALGRWVFVTGVDEIVWVDLICQTLELTGGIIDYPTEVADRCRQAPPSELSLAALQLLLGKGEPWERDYIQSAALDALRQAAAQAIGCDLSPLRTRLIELGSHEAVDIGA
jgi:hypothetical protein